MIFENFFQDVHILNKKDTSWSQNPQNPYWLQKFYQGGKHASHKPNRVNVPLKDFQITSSSKVYIPKKLLQLFDQSLYMKIVSYVNPIFPNIPTMFQNF